MPQVNAPGVVRPPSPKYQKGSILNVSEQQQAGVLPP